MPRSRRFRKNQNQQKTEWGKNNPQTKAKNRKILKAIGIIAVVAVALSAFVVLGRDVLFSTSATSAQYVPMPAGVTRMTGPAGEYSNSSAVVILETFMGNITIQMRDDKPITATNFVNLVKQHLYDNTFFHRILAGFMIQGGQITSTTVPNIQDEIGNDNLNLNGTIAMANAGANTANSQFFINVANNNNLYASFDTSYTVFGQVIGGMDVVMAISQVPVTTNPQNTSEQSQPVSPVALITAYVVNA
jgi:cyclophilin family peptidyl-prolyl cis-trans isomerase